MKKISLFLLIAVFVSGCQMGVDENNGDIGKKNTGQEVMPVKNNDDEKTKISDGKIDPITFDNLVGSYNGVVIKTNLGDIKIRLYNEESPVTVNNFLNLANMNFYDGVKFHRVIKDFMIQSGDPNSKDDDWSDDGMGGPGYRFQDEFNENKLVSGSVAMANSGPNTNGSQFFIVTADSTPWLDGKHANFGFVVEGADVVSSIESVDVDTRDHPINDVIIRGVELVFLEK